MPLPEFIVLCGLTVVLLIFLVYTKKLNVYNLEQNSGTCVLAGQLNRGISSAVLPSPLGQHTYTISSNGELRLNHHQYNPDGGTWSLPPVAGEHEHYTIDPNTVNSFKISIGSSFGNIDRIEVVNPTNNKTIKFSYQID